MIEPIIKVKDIAWVRLRSPDLDEAEKFLSDFGLVRVERTEERLYMRGTDAAHHIHITERGPAKVLSSAFLADSEADLHKLAAEAEGASAVEPIDEPGGGLRVRLTDHNGYTVEVVHGIASAAAIPVQRAAWNTGLRRDRKGEFTRVSTAPSRVKRIGHVVFSTPDVKGSVAWAQRHLGFVASEEVHVEDDPDELLASFNRADRGEEYVDHHIMMFGRYPRVGLNHVSFEVHDVDDVWAGHEWLKGQGYQHCWGIGRHTLGSQIFDYWNDPWGRLHEHWTDSDLLNSTHPYRLLPRSQGLRSQWGPQGPQEFRDAASE
ncbi:Catechol 2,3-dioxygenase [Roseomonas rosea]|uniref:Catechol 2,3-dioxygenase n=1 Tax=Muricoccus roseus TaxID=198092 RepID=A0A1M6PSN4_9PROT|nr:VOC family protein [Roseomonas rosea]SHK10965.1 Catechol 2,3-dioxygenase [Roseomonas rosea]